MEEGENLEIYGKNLLKTQTILMVMLWSYELNKKEELPYISPKYINESNDKNKVCINDTLKHFGIENDVVVDYKSAIEELLKKNKNGECKYYAVWIFCGPKLPILPYFNGQPNTSDPNLVEEFINILIIFWNNGGSLVFFAEGEPLNFQVNLFLEKIEFSNGQKPNFKIAGNYIGDKVLKQDKTGELKDKGVFDKSPKKIIINGIEIERQSLSHNLGLIYEGYTIGYAVNKNDNKRITINEKQNLYPFKPFAINSEGGISTLIYEADEQLRGDIIIDCGYTKCFLNMYKTSTFRFIQNIAGWTARPEVKYFGENLLPRKWRPKGIDYKVNKDAVFNEFINLKTLFAIDYSDSTYGSDFYYTEIKSLIDKYYNEKRGDIIYFWADDYQRIEEKEVIDCIIENENGYGAGTKIDLIVDIINNEKINNFRQLIIITDGIVTEEEIELTDSRFKEIDYVIDYVFVYILGEEPNFSVGVPFCRNIPNKILYKNNSNDNYYTELHTLNKEEIHILNNLEDFSDYNSFMNNYEKICNAFQTQCLGKSQNEILRNQLSLIIDKITKNDNNIIDKNLFNRRINILMGMTKGILKNTFSLEGIKAAIHNYKE